MPNHIHGILWVVDHDPVVGAQRRCASTDRANVIPGSVGAIVRSFKSAVTKRITDSRNAPGTPVWQRNYYEHIIRDERALNAIRQYILENLNRWHLDRYNPERIGDDPLTREIWAMIKRPVEVRPFLSPPYLHDSQVQEDAS